MKQKRKARRYIIPGASLFLLVSILANGFSIWRYAKEDEKRIADAAVVLGASVWGNDPSPVFKERINHGIWLYQNGYVDKLILTGGVSSGNTRSDAGIARDYAAAQGIPLTDILIEEQSVITQENLNYTKQIMQAEGLSQVLIVSDPLHMKRAMRMAKDIGITAYSSPTPTTRYTGMKSKILFLGREVFFYTGYKIYHILGLS